MARILVVEDDPAIALGLEDDLALEGYEVEVVGDGELGTARARDDTFDLVLLDVMLPKKDGFEVCRELRRGGSKIPIIMLTAKTQDAEKVLGLEIGADDYVTKPFSPAELRARIKAVLRRTVNDTPEVYRFGDVAVDFGRFELRRAGDIVHVTPTELRLLSAFVRNRGRVLSRQEITDQVWGKGTAITPRVVDTHVANLRQKVEADAAEPQFIVGVRGVGYRFDG
ncbi:MAG: response regulator transcription factor [Gemmatimonadota bacterium]|nr:MAG: response regulator transcription factor [Gemmatimonadota bacterium]